MKRFSSILTVTVLFVILITSNVFSQETPDELCARLKALRKEQGKPEEAAQQALAFLQTHAEKDIARQKIYYEYCAALFQQQKFDDAKAAFIGLVNEYAETTLDKTSADFMVDDAQYFCAMIEQTQGEKDLDKAIAAYEIVVEKFPKSNWRPNALITIGDIYREKKQYKESIDHYYKVIEEHPNSDLASNAFFYANRALIHSDKEADDQKTEIVEDNSNEIQQNIARMLKDYSEKDITAEAVFDLINYYNTKTDFSKAEEFCKTMFQYYPANKKTARAILEWADLVTRVEGEKHFDEVVGHIDLVKDEAIKRQDSELYENALFYKGLALMRKKDLDSAIAHFESILKDYSETTLKYEIKFLIGSCYIEKKEYDIAIEKLEKMLEEKPGGDWQAAITRTIGTCYHWKHDFEKAKEYYGIVLEKYSGSSWASGLQDEIKSIEEAEQKNNKQ